MLRRTAILLLLALATAPVTARADATFALVWSDTGTQDLTILPGDAAGGGQRTLDILMTIDVQWVFFGMTVGIPDGSPVSFTGAAERAGPSVPGATWITFGRPTLLDVTDPIWNGDLDPYQEAYNFALGMSPPCCPPWAEPGTYVVGSVSIDTSSAVGTTTIESFFVPTLDGLGINDGTGTPVYSDDATFLNAMLGTAQLLVVPEPGTLSLLGGGLLGLLLTRRLHGPG